MQPIPANEMQRILDLSEFDLDYSALDDQFKDLTRLAAKVAGTDISLVNLIDSYTQWTVSNHGLPLDQMPREDSVCQYVIMADNEFEVGDLSADERFKDKFYVAGELSLKYYFGIPLKTEDGNNIGALCVLDTETKKLTPEKVELLKIIANEIVNRLKALKVIESLKHRINEVSENQRRVAHDIRGPLGGIIGLAQLISEQGDENKMEEVLDFMRLIYKSGHSILELADEILSADNQKNVVKLNGDEYNQLTLKDKLEKLYHPQALNKGINFTVTTHADTEVVPFSRNKLLQIIGNIVSNAIKFTPAGGSVSVLLSLQIDALKNNLHVTIKDSGVGMNDEQIIRILSGGNAASTEGTKGEQGYGFGLALVKHLVDGLKGRISISSMPGEGSTFEIWLPQNK